MAEFKNKTYLLSEFINIVKYKEDRSERYDSLYNYAIYAIDDSVTADVMVYVGEPVEIDDSDKEVYPQYAIEHDLTYFCSDENIQDVVDLACSQKGSISNDELIDALFYYLDHDNFLDFV